MTLEQFQLNLLISARRSPGGGKAAKRQHHPAYLMGIIILIRIQEASESASTSIASDAATGANSNSCAGSYAGPGKCGALG